MQIPGPIAATVARAERLLVSRPLHLLDERVIVPRLGARSPAHRALSLGVTALDTFVGLPPRTDPPPVAGAPASTPVTPAPAPEPERLPADEAAHVQSLTDDLLEAERDVHLEGELADDAEIRRVQAEVRAKQLVEDDAARVASSRDDGA